MVFLQDGIKLVVVALGATNSESEEHFAGDVGHLGHDEIPLHAGVALVPFVNAEPKESGANQSFRIVRGEFIGCQLFPDELVVGLVFVERTDDIVPVAPGVGTVAVGTIAITFSIAYHIEPVLSPALAIARTGE